MQCTHQNRKGAAPSHADPLGQNEMCLDCGARHDSTGWSGGNSLVEDPSVDLQFWIVWCADGAFNTNVVMHFNVDNAIEAAETYARQHVGKEFVVLKAMTARRVPKPSMLRIRYATVQS